MVRTIAVILLSSMAVSAEVIRWNPVEEVHRYQVDIYNIEDDITVTTDTTVSSELDYSFDPEKSYEIRVFTQWYQSLSDPAVIRYPLEDATEPEPDPLPEPEPVRIVDVVGMDSEGQKVIVVGADRLLYLFNLETDEWRRLPPIVVYGE